MMNPPATGTEARPDESGDEPIIRRVLEGEADCFELLMRRHNRRVYRTVRAILRSDHEVEDVMQEAYVNAFAHLKSFGQKAQFSTWLTRIAVHEAYARLRRDRRIAPLPDLEDEALPMESPLMNPEQQVMGRELGALLEQAVDALPESFRAVFMLRAIEQLSIVETAEVLDIPEDTVKTRLHRAKGLLQKTLEDRVGTAVPMLFDFHAARCDRVVASVLKRIGVTR